MASDSGAAANGLDAVLGSLRLDAPGPESLLERGQPEAAFLAARAALERLQPCERGQGAAGCSGAHASPWALLRLRLGTSAMRGLWDGPLQRRGPLADTRQIMQD